MSTGFETALSEITLVLFTTLAPSGVVAFIIMGIPLLRGSLGAGDCRRLNTYLVLPLAVSMVGLVASATHLGNPANALYVFLGVGRSPLSTEVFCAVLFLAFAGLYWLYSFADAPKHILQRVWLFVTMFTGAVFVVSIAFAYSAETIISWNTVYTPLSLILNALVGGPILALLGFCVAQYKPTSKSLGKKLLSVSTGALLVNLACYILQAMALKDVENSFSSVFELAPYYGWMVFAFALLCLLSLVVAVISMKRFSCLPLQSALAACALMFCGIFVMRFSFYMMHMTVGLSL